MHCRIFYRRILLINFINCHEIYVGNESLFFGLAVDLSAFFSAEKKEQQARRWRHTRQREQRLHVKYWIMARRSRTTPEKKNITELNEDRESESKHSVHKICERTSSWKIYGFWGFQTINSPLVIFLRSTLFYEILKWIWRKFRNGAR